jgi:hypothetical protein
MLSAAAFTVVISRVLLCNAQAIYRCCSTPKCASSLTKSVFSVVNAGGNSVCKMAAKARLCRQVAFALQAKVFGKCGFACLGKGL